MLYGLYNGKKYQIIDTKNNEVIYTAGNAKGDSQGYVDEENGVGIDTMQKYCIQTGKELAKENNTIFNGAEMDEEI